MFRKKIRFVAGKTGRDASQPQTVEEKDGEYCTGHAPNYVKVYALGENLHNEIRTVTVTGVYRDGVVGEMK